MCLGEIVVFNCGHMEPVGKILFCFKPPCKLKSYFGKKSFNNTLCRTCRMRKFTHDRLVGSTSVPDPETALQAPHAGNHVSRGHPVIHPRREGLDMERSAVVDSVPQVLESEGNLHSDSPTMNAGKTTLPPTPPRSPPKALKQTSGVHVPSQRRGTEIGTARQQVPRQKPALDGIPCRGKRVRQASPEDSLNPGAQAQAFTTEAPHADFPPTRPAQLQVEEAGRSRSNSDLRRHSAHRYLEGDRPLQVPDVTPLRSTSNRHHPPKTGKRIESVNNKEAGEGPDVACAAKPKDGNTWIASYQSRLDSARRDSMEGRLRPEPNTTPVRSASNKHHPPMTGKRIDWADNKDPRDGPNVACAAESHPATWIESYQWKLRRAEEEAFSRAFPPDAVRPLDIVGPVIYGPSSTSADKMLCKPGARIWRPPPCNDKEFWYGAGDTDSRDWCDDESEIRDCCWDALNSKNGSEDPKDARSGAPGKGDGTIETWRLGIEEDKPWGK